MEDEREAKRELKRMQSEAEKKVKRRIVREHFKGLFKPLEKLEADSDANTGFVKQVLKAVQTLIAGEGDIGHVENQCNTTWAEEAASTEAPVKDEETGSLSSLGFDLKAFI
jgi:5'-deoxynucleotidase YfbR-like HD superfamily hydrolase